MLSLTGCSSFNEYMGLADDNLIEEYIEEYIEDELGIGVDLTPESLEI